MNKDDKRVEEFLRDTEEQLTYLEDETRSLVMINARLQIEILRELRRQRMSIKKDN